MAAETAVLGGVQAAFSSGAETAAAATEFPEAGVRLPLNFHGESIALNWGERTRSTAAYNRQAEEASSRDSLAHKAGRQLPPAAGSRAAACPLTSAPTRHPPCARAVVRSRGLSPVTDDAIEEQVEVLNSDYAGTGIQFAAPAVTFYDRAPWAADCWGKLGEILAEVNTEAAQAVNVVVCDLASSGGIIG